MTGTIEMQTAATDPAVATRAGGDFATLLSGFRAKLEGELARWLAAKRSEAAISGLPSDLELIDGVTQLVVRGGKRLRPALVYYSYRALGGEADPAVLPLALATELLHTYLLLHDDIMDHAEVRRGLPAAHARFREAHRARGWRGDAAEFGAAVGILLGDLAHTWAVELYSSVPVEGARAAELGRCFSAMCQEVIGGQYLELLVASRRESEQADEEELLSVLRLKSGRYTAERPIQLGGILAGAAPGPLAELARFGSALGEAFQLQDDLLGMFGDAATVGKPVGADLTEGKFTFLIFHALKAADPAERQALTHALGRPDLTLKEVARVREILVATGARARVEGMVEERLEQARQALAGLRLAEPGRTFMAGLIDYLKERRD
ncbi:MAG TPA: polyprenyl synthetase family protein [Thermoanaerobaculia bacterium]|nr:polyprenyl synthetase family protein [Thermoanaerobaculia bacterium]